MSTRIAVAGAAGRMGQAIIRLIHERYSGQAVLSGALEHPSSVSIGQDAAGLAGIPMGGVKIVSDPVAALENADALIDFSHAQTTPELVKLCAQRSLPVVVGTTGFNQEQKELISGYESKIPLLVAPNMSVGVNLLFGLVAKAAQILGDDYDVEITEAHHRHKKDAPSGTAVRLKEVLLETLGRNEQDVLYGREGMIGARGKKEIGIHAIRGGDTVGEHTIHFYTEGEKVELTHVATSRNTFASGAVRGALYLVGKKPGRYSMNDVLGI